MEEILDYTIYGCPFMDNEKTYWKKVNYHLTLYIRDS
jgi:hypothetical protein